MGETEEIYEETSAYVTCNSCGVVYSSTYEWLGAVLSGVLAACVVVCAVRAVVSRSVFLFCRRPMCGFTSA